MISRSRPGPRLPGMDTMDTAKRRIHPGLLLAVLLTGPFMAQADATIVNVAVPACTPAWAHQGPCSSWWSAGT